MGGDGTGPEGAREGLKVLKAVAPLENLRYETHDYDLGGERYLRTGEILPDSVLAELRNVDAIYLGAIGHPEVAPGILERGLLRCARWAFDYCRRPNRNKQLPPGPKTNVLPFAHDLWWRTFQEVAREFP